MNLFGKAVNANRGKAGIRERDAPEKRGAVFLTDKSGYDFFCGNGYRRSINAQRCLPVSMRMPTLRHL